MKVTMFKANDGQLFETQILCAKHNSELAMRPLLTQFVRENAKDLGMTDGIGSIYEDDVPVFVDILIDNADFLRTVFKEAAAETRGRKPKTPAKPSLSELAANLNGAVPGSAV